MFRILVCDDDREIVHAIELYLSEEGYEVLCAYDGMEAAEVVRRENVHLLIVDIMMPKMDGFEVLAFIKKKKLECQPCGYYDLCGQFSCEYKTGI